MYWFGEMSGRLAAGVSVLHSISNKILPSYASVCLKREKYYCSNTGITACLFLGPWPKALGNVCEQGIVPPTWNLHLDRVILCIKKKQGGIRARERVPKNLFHRGD